MQEPSIPDDEAQRIATLHALNILDTPLEERFDRITRLARHILAVPVALVSLVDSKRQWFKSCQGLDVRETPRNISFCGHAILGSDVFVVEDALLDARFADNPLVIGEPHIRFYAGQPLRTKNGSGLGTLCIIDYKPRHLSETELTLLRDLAAMVEDELDVHDTHAANIALHDNENRLHAILDNVIDGIITISERGIIESFNHAAETIFGYTAAEVIGSNVKMLMPEPYHGEHDGYLHNYVTTERKKIIGIGREVIGRRKDGSTFPMDLAVSEMKIGSTRMFTGIVRDISEKKEAERKLAVTNRLNQAILNGADHIIISTTTDGTILTFNQAAERALGYAADDLIGKESPAIFHDPEEVKRRALELQAAGIAVEPGFEVFVALARKGEADSNEWSYIRKDGSRFPVMLTATALFTTKGEVSGFLGIATDISEQKRTEQSLLETSQSLSRAQQIANIGNWSWNIETNALSWSDEIYRIFGLQPQQFGASYEAFMQSVHPDDRERVQKAVNSGLSSGAYSIDHRIVLPDGSEKFVHEQGEVEFGEDGKALRMEGTVQDVTERLRIERMKTEFISTVSHELRTPLTSIHGALGLIAGGVTGELPAQAKALVDIAHKNSERLILLVNDILDMEKIESGKMHFNLKSVELVPLVEQALEANRAYAEQFKVSYEFECTQAVPATLVDVDRFMQVLANFLSNAAKFSPAGGVVSVAVQTCEHYVRASVTDRGQGIPASFHGKIFQKFSQADSSDTRSKGGTGLGLSITKALVEGMGGQIGFTSESGVGTTFFAEFPVVADVQGAHSGSAPQAVPTPRQRILICEDDKDVAKLLQMVLGQGGYDSDLAYSADEAKKLLQLGSYQAITMDLMLSGQNGLSLMHELQGNAATSSIPVIVVSATAGVRGKELDSGLVILDWISKPIDETRLLSALQRISQAGKAKPVILHVEDDEDICRVLLALIGSDGTVVAAHTLADAKRKMLSMHVDLIILDLGLPDGAGIELLSFMNSKGLDTPVIIFSATELNEDVARQVKAALVKSRTSNEQLLARIKQII